MATKQTPLWLSDEEFLESFKNVPRLAVNLLISDGEGRILLTRRNIPPLAGFWHFPGGFLLKNESITECQRRVAKKELDLELSDGTNVILLGAFDNITGEPRGHIVDLIYGLTVNDVSGIKPTKETLETKFFGKGKLPEDIGFNHRETLAKLGY